MPLAMTKKNMKCCVRYMPRIPLLEALGVRKGVALQVICKQPLHGPVIVRVGNRDIAIDRQIAQQILVEGVC